MGDELNKLIDDTASGKQPVTPGTVQMHPRVKFPNEMIDHEYIRKIVREELTKIVMGVGNYPESELLYETMRDKMEGNAIGHRNLPENAALNMFMRDLLESIKKEK